MTIGKAITLFLIDADPTGRIAAELYNWTGKVYKLPRTLVKQSLSRIDLQKAGVYLLFGRDETNPEMPLVYVGEAEEIHKRISQHSDKDFWNEVVVCISKDDNLNKAHIKFLEHELHKALREVGRATLQNSVVPTQPRISELETAFLVEFFENLKLLVSTLGYRVFEPPVKVTPQSPQKIYLIQAARGAQAKAIRTNEGMVVLEGSRAAATTVPSAPPWVIEIRQHLEETRVIDGTWTFIKDYTFASPSTAAAVVIGAQCQWASRVERW
jgi:hypothetical protein